MKVIGRTRLLHSSGPVSVLHCHCYFSQVATAGGSLLVQWASLATSHCLRFATMFECLCAPQCLTKRFPKPVWSKSFPPFFILLLRLKTPPTALLLPLLLRILTSASSSYFLVSSQLKGTLTGYGIHCDFRTGWKCLLLKAGQTDEGYFRVIRLLCKEAKKNYWFASFRKKWSMKNKCKVWLSV